MPDALSPPFFDGMNVTLITGFLGAGKTTFLSRLIHEHATIRKLGFIEIRKEQFQKDPDIPAKRQGPSHHIGSSLARSVWPKEYSQVPTKDRRSELGGGNPEFHRHTTVMSDFCLRHAAEANRSLIGNSGLQVSPPSSLRTASDRPRYG
ncbi:hypothetical protein JIN85_15140 [Luteolibacter pohnpeiensis]|uniref:CobW/HypB/UreG nucleotide-binding domain-containing protein n=1 Tax=Luteolibacter pohnpeiensis TaxID=454153 RepID=A0A934SCR9_9BACT|nr:hypothetical protein [Luteolibacter pohnpeiensis]